MNIAEKQEEIIEEFSMYDDWMEKYEHIIALGKSLPLIDPIHKTPEHIIQGCQSNVWLHAALEDGKVIFTADSDALITKGLIALMIDVLSGHSPADISKANIHFIDAIGLKQHLSPTRSNGLLSMLKQMKLYAIAFEKLNSH